jgi:hypothetical protein
MAEFAPVAPLEIMRELMRYGNEAIGHYHLLLAHDVLAHQDDWSTWRQEMELLHRSGRIDNPLVIMDSSVIEEGVPRPLAECVAAARIVRANVIVLPDVIGDAASTLNHLAMFEEYHGAHRDDSYIQNVEWMFVPQGKELLEYVDSLEQFERFSHMVNWIGLPRDALKYGITSRQQLVDIVSMVYPSHNIHLLGFSDNFLDDMLVARSSLQICGIDSAVPVRAKRPLSLTTADYGKREDFWESTELLPDALANISKVRNWVM